jgi:hypothetical protein
MRLLLPMLAVASLVIAGILVIGCIIRLQISVGIAVLGSKSYGSSLRVEGGLVSISIASWPSSLPHSAHLYVETDPPRIRLADWTRALWTFGEVFVNSGAFNARTVAFSFWVPWTVCLIAPALWVRRQRKLRKSPRGFEVKTD